MPGIPWFSIDALHVYGPVGSCPRDPCREHHHAIIFSAVDWLLAETKAPHAPPRPRKPSFPSRSGQICRAVVFSSLEEKGRQAREIGLAPWKAGVESTNDMRPGAVTIL